MRKNLLYSQARSSIMTGDLIALRDRSGFLPVLTRLITRSPYTHTAIAVWVEACGIKRLLVAESNASGSSLSPLSGYAHIDFDVFRCPVSREVVQKTAWRLLGEKIHYDVMDLARIAANRIFGIRLPLHDDKNLVCSAFSASIYHLAGWRPESLPSIPAPDDVVAALDTRPLLRVRNDESR